MILVTGATGTVGREVLRRLPAGVRVRALSRDPSRVRTDGRVEAVAGDYRDPASLARALAGVRVAFLVTVRVGGDDDERFLRAARAAGVRRVVKLSAAAVEDPSADDLITRWQRGAEEALRASGLEWTLLRPRAFMSNTLSWAPSVRSERVVRALYGSSAGACVDPGDVAEVAARALTGDGYAGTAHLLTGPQALSAVQQTAELGRLLGVPLRFEELDEAAARVLLGRRHPGPVVEALLSSARRQRAGAKGRVSGTVGEVTGRPARSYREWARERLAEFA